MAGTAECAVIMSSHPKGDKLHQGRPYCTWRLYLKAVPWEILITCLLHMESLLKFGTVVMPVGTVKTFPGG